VSRALDRPGAVISVFTLAGLGLGAFVLEKANRVMPGIPHGLFAVAPSLTLGVLVAALAGVIGISLFARGGAWRLGAALFGLIVLLWAVGDAAAHLAADRVVVRVAPGPGFWLGFMGLGMMATDAMTRLKPRAIVRVGLLLGAAALFVLVFGSGCLDALSVMREYAANATRFAAEVRRHLLLSSLPLGLAVLIGVPIGLSCRHSEKLTGVILGVLNVVQTVPSIALFGILMAPLALLARVSPTASALGIAGIGMAPALVALFLYSLLPIVANTVAGIRGVPPTTVEAALGMGLTPWQVLWRIEWPLALPTLLAGIRIVLVQNIGLAAIAALIGGGGLGTFIFQGIGQTAIDLVLLGALPMVVLALTAGVLLDALTEFLRRAPA
jgi:osmoprotectant transport system permease protein